MTFVKGKSGNPGGRGTEKPWADAIKRAVAMEGPDGRKKLFEIAQTCVEAAIGGDMVAIKEIGDRLDGKPAQESTLNIRKHDATDWTIADLDAIIAADEGASSSRTEAPTAGRTEPDIIH